MNYKMIGKFIGKILLVEAVFMLPAYAISLYYHEEEAVRALLISMVITLLTGGVMVAMTRGTRKGFHAKEGMVCVGISWIVLALFGALPFFFSGAFAITRTMPSTMSST